MNRLRPPISRSFAAILIALVVSIGSGSARGEELSDLDRDLRQLITRSRITPLPPRVDRRGEPLFTLGRSLFFDKNLSGNRNISCASCHNPRFGTSDALALSLGQGAIIVDDTVKAQGDGAVIRRHTPALFNLGDPALTNMFWDGRVRYDRSNKTFTTPYEGLNGKRPALAEVVKVLDGALAAQVIFPLLSPEEMLGHEGENELADARSPAEAWQRIVDRLLDDPIYPSLLSAAFPGTRDFNIGHVGKALAFYIAHAFQAVDTPYDRYLRGDKNALTAQEKRGLKVFLGPRANCVSCHGGPHLANPFFANVGVPMIKADETLPQDQGRIEVTGKATDLYSFKIAPLRNVGLTAPYMHNGAFLTLEEVVRHYNNPERSLEEFHLSHVHSDVYNKPLVLHSVESDLKELRKVSPRITRGRKSLELTEAEISDLVEFLRTALTDESYLRHL